MDKKIKSRIGAILYFLKGSKAAFFIAVLFACLLVFFDLMNPKLIGYIVDLCVGDYDALPDIVNKGIDILGGREYLLSHLYLAAGIVIVFALAGALCRYVFSIFNTIGGEKLIRRIRDILYEHILNLPDSWHDNNKTGDIIQRSTSDVENIKSFISDQLTGLFRIVVMISLALYFMFRLNVKLALAASVFIPIIILYSIVFHGKIGRSFEKADIEEGRVSAIVQENLTGVRVVRAFGREEFERRRFVSRNKGYTELWISVMKILSKFWAINDMISGLQILTVVAFGAYLCVYDSLSAGSYVAFISYNAMLTFPIRHLGRTITEMSKAGISIDRIMYIVNSDRDFDDPCAGEYPGNGDIVFDHVSYAYKTDGDLESKKVLDDVSFTVKKGSTIGILGGTGSGKSTIIELLDAMYSLEEGCGTISLNGIDIKMIKKKELRKNIGMVRQEPYLFSRTLKENIMITNPMADEMTFNRAVETACLDTAVEHFAKGYDTYVGERGVTLSGGQKQRTAIARMLIMGTDICIFDDSLSAVDAETDSKIRTRLKSLSGMATVIMVSHRITTLMNADNILVLEGGKLVESGTHKELLQRGGIYRHIYDLQTGQGS